MYDQLENLNSLGIPLLATFFRYDRRLTSGHNDHRAAVIHHSVHAGPFI